MRARTIQAAGCRADLSIGIFSKVSFQRGSCSGWGVVILWRRLTCQPLGLSCFAVSVIGQCYMFARYVRGIEATVSPTCVIVPIL